jgi:hypothetical protein
MSPAQKDTKVAISVGRKMSAALKPARPWLAAMLWRMAITEVGISVTPAVLSTRNMIIGLLATALSGLSSCNSFIAFRPSGVAALSSPSMLALKFITMLPLAGWPRGMSGKTRRNKGSSARAKSAIIPARSPIFMMPSHRLITPTRPSEMSKPVLAVSKRPVRILLKTSTSPWNSLTSATAKPTRMKATQIALRTMAGDCRRAAVAERIGALRFPSPSGGGP